MARKLSPSHKKKLLAGLKRYRAGLGKKTGKKAGKKAGKKTGKRTAKKSTVLGTIRGVTVIAETKK